MRGIDPIDLRKLVIEPVLEFLGLDVDGVEGAAELLLGTALQESGGARWLKQVGGGPALGVWEMEPATYVDIWRNFLGYRPELAKRVRAFALADAAGALDDATLQLQGNLYYACAMARIRYARVADPLPAAGDIEAQAAYYKQFYNTPGGAATTAEYIANWRAAMEPA